jgi:hypothetical protein
MTPQNNDPQLTADRFELLGALHAVHLLLTQAQWKAATKISRSGKNQKQTIDYIMDAVSALNDAIDKIQSGGPVIGPNCRPGFHEEFGICVPDNA